MAKQAPKKPAKKTAKAAQKAASQAAPRAAAETTAAGAATRTTAVKVPARPSAARRPTKAQLIEELNNDLAKEYSALIQYIQHAAVITGPQYDAIRAELAVHATEEHAHALSLSEQIDFLGGVPGVDVGDVHISSDSKVMLEYDLEGELDAIGRYRARIGQAEMLQEYGLRRALEDILIIEEEHARDLQNALDL